VLDQASGKYLAEMYHPERNDELLLRTEALYETQEAAVLGVVQLFKNAIFQFPREDRAPRIRRKTGKPKKKKAPKAGKARRKQTKAKRKQTSKRRR
jgi:hypothetical protein